jgi:hypothetical protein
LYCTWVGADSGGLGWWAQEPRSHQWQIYFCALALSIQQSPPVLPAAGPGRAAHTPFSRPLAHSLPRPALAQAPPGSHANAACRQRSAAGARAADARQGLGRRRRAPPRGGGTRGPPLAPGPWRVPVWARAPIISLGLGARGARVACLAGRVPITGRARRGSGRRARAPRAGPRCGV